MPLAIRFGRCSDSTRKRGVQVLQNLMVPLLIYTATCHLHPEEVSLPDWHRQDASIAKMCLKASLCILSAVSVKRWIRRCYERQVRGDVQRIYLQDGFSFGSISGCKASPRAVSCCVPQGYCRSHDIVNAVLAPCRYRMVTDS